VVIRFDLFERAHTIRRLEVSRNWFRSPVSVSGEEGIHRCPRSKTVQVNAGDRSSRNCRAVVSSLWGPNVDRIDFRQRPREI